jgi:hypothetical protein
MGFEDVFQGVSFPDATIQVGGAPQDAGNAGTPAPAKVEGQPAASPAVKADQDASNPEKNGEQPNKDGKVEDPNKPLPYDKDPKWLKARAAEKALTDILEKHGLLNAEELAERLEKGESLQKILGTRDAKKVLDDAEYADRVRKNWDKQKLEKQYEGETPDARVERLERENADLRRTHDDYKSTVEEREHAQQVLKSFNTEVNKVLDALETPTPETERELLTLYLGVNNPANDIDIEDQTAVRKMTREGITRFQAAVQKIKQSAIDDYVAGKSKLAVDTSKGAPASVQQGVNKKPLSKDVRVDDAFEASKQELLELLAQGLESPS